MTVAGTPALTITTGLSTTADLSTTAGLSTTTGLSTASPLTLVVTLPVTAAQALAPASFLSERGAMESVLRQGEALFAQLQVSQTNAEANYQAQLNAVVQRNSYIEQTWLARLHAYQRYQTGYPAYQRRVAAFNAYAHRLHLAGLQLVQWQLGMAAWTRYAQQMAAYKAAVAAQRQHATAPISGTTPLSSTAPGAVPLPPKPVMPPYPGPQPPPFTETPPAWPGAPPTFALNPGPEPGGWALPLPPEAIPPWDGAAQLVTLAQYDTGTSGVGVGAAGIEETTQAALLADGAFSQVGAYQDPVKGPISTYWGDRTIFQSFHTGIDIAAPLYTPIRAAAAGVVTFAGYAVPGQRHDSYGLCVIIQHNAHFSTLYAHMDDLSYGLRVRRGDVVQQGQIIGYIGLTGWTTGPHLHFEMRENNVQFNPLLLLPNPATS